MWGLKLNLVAFALASLLVGSGFAQQSVMISTFATDLSGCDDLSACDTVVKIMCASDSGDWTQCGITAEIKDDNFPVFPERFTFSYVAGTNQRWRFDLVDKDLLVDDPIASATISMEEFITSTPPFSTHRFTLENGRGNFFVHHREM